jgi:hypothetical protein
MADLPETYNGEPTRYHLFDGFRESSGLMKAVYIASAFTGLGILIPALVEAYAYGKAVQAEKQEKRSYGMAVSPSPSIPTNYVSQDLSSAPLITQDPNTSSKFQDTIAQQRFEQGISRQM